MNTENKHTPTPYEVYIQTGIFKGRIALANTCVTSDISFDEQKANAEFIVRACNSHEVLIDALIEAEDAIIEALGDLTDHFTIKHVKSSLETVQKALKQTKGE